MLARIFHNCNFLNGSTNAHWQFSLLQQPLFMVCFVFVISSICVLSSNYTTELSRADEALISCSCYSSFSRSTKKLVAKWMVAQPLISLCRSLTLFHPHSPHIHTHFSLTHISISKSNSRLFFHSHPPVSSPIRVFFSIFLDTTHSLSFRHTLSISYYS